MATSSKLTYKRAWKLMRIYLKRYHGSLDIQLPVNVDYLLEYIQLLKSNRYAVSTIKTYTSSIGYFHRINGFPDPSNHPMVLQVLKTLAKDPECQKPDAREPITKFTLHQLLDQLQVIFHDNTYKCLLFSVMFILLFSACLRINELCYDKKAPQNTLKLSNLKIDNGLIITFNAYKHHNGQYQLNVSNQAFDSLNPTLAVQRYLELRGKQPGPLCMDIQGRPVHRSQFLQVLRKTLRMAYLDHLHINTHSFRIGCASHLWALGWSDVQIKSYGRWRSNAIYKYFRQAHP